MRVSVKKLNRTFGAKKVFSDFSASFSQGIHFLHGPNGSGKTTLLNVLGGADRDYQGELWLDDLNATRQPEQANRYRSFLPGELRFYPGIRSSEFLSWVAGVRGLSASALLASGEKVFGLNEEILRKEIENLSLGQRKRVFLTAALLAELSVWILDEPTNGLDSRFRASLVERILEFGKKGTVLMASHDLAFAEELDVRPRAFRVDESSGVVCGLTD